MFLGRLAAGIGLAAALALTGATTASATDRAAPSPDRSADSDRSALSAQRAVRLAARVEPGTLEGGRIRQAGWWSRVNEDPPETGLVAPPAPPAPGVPAGALPVAVSLGEHQRISALEFALDGKPGSRVDSLVLTLRESTEPGGAVNADLAGVLACPITDRFWVAVDNGPWTRVPEHDCELASVAGQRDAETGTWVFDLTPLATDWLAEDASTSPAVVLVAETTDENGAPRSFQVAADGVAADGIGLLARTSPGLGGTDAPTTDGPTSAAAGGTTTGSSGTGAAGTVGTAADSGSTGIGTPSAGVPAAAEAPSAAAAEAADQTPVAAVAAGPRPWWGGLGGSTMLLLPVALGLAYLTMLAMGPDAQPVPVSTARRGVSRALDTLRQAGVGAMGRVGR